MTTAPSPASSEAAVFDASTRAAAAMIDPAVDPDVMAFGLTIMRAGNRLQQDMENDVHRPAGSTWAAFRVMFTIRSVGAITPKRLARLSNTSAQSISSVLNTLERQGLVARTPDLQDARSVWIDLTPEGRRLVEELVRRNNARTAQWAEIYTADERATLVALLHRLFEFSPPHPTGAGDADRPSRTT